jgi:hypothetical protein
MRIVLALAILLSLGVFLFSEEEKQLTKLEETDQVSVSSSAAQRAPAITKEEQRALEEQQKETVQEESNIVAPKRYFPGAKVLSRIEIPSANGEIRVLKTVETNLKEPYVVVEELFQGSTVAANLIDQSAMVANQLLVAQPEGIEVERLFLALRSAGAVEIHKSGDNFLATFAALPDDPRALEQFKERLLASADFELVIEPNYIRKIF